MSRVDRVLDLLEHLRATGLTTVDAVADELGVSRRTVLRDTATLRRRGWPIRASTGPGGGIYLDRDRGVTAVHLATDELTALWLAAQMAVAVGQVPWARAARTGLDKLLASVPVERARAVRGLVGRLIVGRPATERIRAEVGTPSPALLATLEHCFAYDRCLAFSYVDRHGRRTRRSIEPHGLLVEAPAWYILARDIASGAPRMFRMDRIEHPRPTERTFAPAFEELGREACALRETDPRH